MEWGMVDLDLNVGLVSPTYEEEDVNLEDWVAPVSPLHEQADIMFREAIQRHRSRNLQLSVENSIPLHWLVDPSEAPVGGPSVAGLAGEAGGVVGGVAVEGRSEEVGKACENHVSFVKDGWGGEGERAEKKMSNEEGSFFDCNICLDLAEEAVVTCCGHLFCWCCIYNWIHVHSDARECPVCKGEVTDNTLIPIYGLGNHTRKTDEDSGDKIPARPPAKRVESIRQTIQRATSSFTLEEIVHHVGARFDDIFQLQTSNDGNREMLDRSSVLNRILTSQNMPREQNRGVASENVVDLTQDRAETSGQRRLPPLTYRRRQSQSQSHRGLEAYLGRPAPVQSSEQPPASGDDRDSFSSIAAVIHGETISTSSSSRRRNEASRASDVDSGESRALRRRRLV